MPEKDLERRSIDTIRVLAMDAVQKANAGHPGTAMALAPVAYLIYTELMRHNPADPDWPDRDRFVLSAGHACILQYATLHLTGYDLTLDDLKQFRQWGSRTPGHPEHFLTPGVETTTGPLGQGVANGVGFGVAERFLAQRYNRPHHEIVDHRVYCICSDGDLMEGVASEAASIAGHLGLGKLIYLYDDNRITIDGTTALSFAVEDKGKRFEAYGWHVQHVHDVNDLDELRAAYRAAEDEVERPSLIVAHTHIAYPAPHAIDTAKAHGSPLGEDEVRATKEVLGWDPDETFVVPDGVYEHMSQKARGAEAQAEWRKRFDAWSEAFPEERKDWDQVHTGRPRSRVGASAPRVPGRRGRGYPRRRQEGHAGVQAVHADHARRCGRPGRVHEDRVRGRRRLLGTHTPDATSPSASASTAWARSSTASRCTAASSSRTARPSSSSPTTCARPSASPRSATSCRLGLDARLDRARRGRPHTPAGRALRGAARDPEPLVRPACGRERDRLRLEARPQARGRPRGAVADAPEGADARPLRPRACVGRGAGRIRPLGVRRRPT